MISLLDFDKIDKLLWVLIFTNAAGFRLKIILLNLLVKLDPAPILNELLLLIFDFL